MRLLSQEPDAEPRLDGLASGSTLQSPHEVPWRSKLLHVEIRERDFRIQAEEMRGSVYFVGGHVVRIFDDSIAQGRARQGSVERNSCREGYIREHCSFEFLL